MVPQRESLPNIGTPNPEGLNHYLKEREKTLERRKQTAIKLAKRDNKREKQRWKRTLERQEINKQPEKKAER